MKEEHILISSDGPDNNVLKFKPPMVFSEANVDWLVSVLDRILTEVEQDMEMEVESSPTPITLEVIVFLTLITRNSDWTRSFLIRQTLLWYVVVNSERVNYDFLVRRKLDVCRFDLNKFDIFLWYLNKFFFEVCLFLSFDWT